MALMAVPPSAPRCAASERPRSVGRQGGSGGSGKRKRGTRSRLAGLASGRSAARTEWRRRGDSGAAAGSRGGAAAVFRCRSAPEAHHMAAAPILMRGSSGRVVAGASAASPAILPAWMRSGAYARNSGAAERATSGWRARLSAPSATLAVTAQLQPLQHLHVARRIRLARPRVLPRPHAAAAGATSATAARWPLSMRRWCLDHSRLPTISLGTSTAAAVLAGGSTC